MRLYEFENQLRFVGTRYIWDEPDHGRIEMIDNGGEKWMFVLNVQSRSDGLLLDWRPADQSDGEDTDQKVEESAKRGQLRQVGESLKKALVELLDDFAKSHSDEGAIYVSTQRPPINLSIDWNGLAARLRMEAAEKPGEVRLTRLRR